MIELVDAEAADHLVGLAPGVNRSSGVTGPARVEKKAVVAEWPETGIGELMFLGFGLLQADDIGAL